MKASLAVRTAQANVTPREVEVITLMSQGMRNKEIAASLGISDETVHVHLKSIFTKLRVNDRTGAMNVALRRGIIHIDNG
jgi:DNA-binding NarL/FixJ family response regulator